LTIGYHRRALSLRQQARRLTETLVNIILPPVCACCQRVGDLFCTDCRANILWIVEPICHHCGRPQFQSVERCPNCLAWPLSLDRVRAATAYTGPIPPVIHQMKYEGYHALVRPLAELMVYAWQHFSEPVDLVLPIPLHPDRRRERGYNQSELLVQSIQSKLGWATDFGILRRIRHTRPQVGLSPSDRRANVHGAFAVEADTVIGKRILLVDDVFTTGATLTAAADVLLAAGASRVSAYCLASAAGDQNQLQL
jgi:ComF family protein